MRCNNLIQNPVGKFPHLRDFARPLGVAPDPALPHKAHHLPCKSFPHTKTQDKWWVGQWLRDQES